MLRQRPGLRRKVMLVQLVVPSREDIPAYDSLKDRVDSLVGEILGEFSEGSWFPSRTNTAVGPAGTWSRTTGPRRSLSSPPSRTG